MFQNVCCIHTCKTFIKQLFAWPFFKSRLQVGIKNSHINPLKIALLTYHTSVSVNCLFKGVCAIVSVLNFLLALDGCHSSSEICVTNFNRTTVSCILSYVISPFVTRWDAQTMVPVIQRNKDTGCCVVLWLWLLARESTHLLMWSVWQRHTWLI